MGLVRLGPCRCRRRIRRPRPARAGEEIGLELAAVPERLFKIDACEATGQEFVWVYRCEHEGPFQLDPDELSDGGWFAPKKITDWIAATSEDFAPAFVLIWQLLRDK